MGDVFIQPNENEDTFFICEWINTKDFKIVKVFYSALKAREYLHSITYWKRDK